MIKSKDGMIFVFGSNKAGVHGAGAAKYALENMGAIYGKGRGQWGQSYALPTKNRNIRSLSIEDIAKEVHWFKQWALIHQHTEFQVTQVGCGLAGFTKEQIAPLFKGSPSNCYFDLEWQPLLGDSHNYWM